MKTKIYSICELQGRGQEPVELFRYSFVDQDPQIGDEIWIEGESARRITRRIWRHDGCLLLVVGPVGLVPA